MEFNIPTNPLPEAEFKVGGSDSSNSNLNQIGHFQELTAGAGNTVFKVNEYGLFMGAAAFASAPFTVNYKGEVVGTKFTIKTPSGTVLLDTNSTSGDYLNVINTNLDTSAKKILGNFSFGVSGAISINTDSNNGLWLSPAGILAKNAGNTTFAIDVLGNATFLGTVSAGSVIAANLNADLITAGTLVGRTLKANNGAGTDIWINNSGSISFRYSNSQKGYLYCDTGGTMQLAATDNMFITYNEDGGGDAFAVVNDTDIAFVVYDDKTGYFPAGGCTFGGDIYGSGSYWSTGYVKGKHVASDGTTGKTGPSTYGFVTAVESSRAKWREFTVRDGIITSVSSESGWQ